LNGKIICMISALAYGKDDGFVGFYIVSKEYRGRGYGLRIFQHGMEYLKGRTVGLDGVPAQVHNYLKSGFVPCHRDVTYVYRETPDSTTVTTTHGNSATNSSSLSFSASSTTVASKSQRLLSDGASTPTVSQEADDQKQSFNSKETLRKLNSHPASPTFDDIRTVALLSPGVNFEALLQYVNSFFPQQRDLYYEKYLQQPTARAFVSLRKKAPSTTDDRVQEEIVGYACIRKAPIGYKIAPIFAENVNIAHNLLIAVIDSVLLTPGEPMFLSVPDYHSTAIEMVGDAGFKPNGSYCQRMFRYKEADNQGPPAIPNVVRRAQVFASGSLEVG